MNAPHETPARDQARIQAAIERHLNEPGALLPMLHVIQDAVGYVPRSAVADIAVALNLSRAEVHGVVTYYHHFRSEPAGRHVVQVCRAESCQSMGADALMAHASLKFGCEGAHGTSVDGRYTLEPVYCLGLCAMSPAIAVDGEVHARVTPASFDEIVAEAANAEVPA